MGKGWKNEPSLHAFTRMNFLYQASLLISRDSGKSQLANYYGKLVKDISKKTVEKVHPDVKKTLCKGCSFPLLTQPGSLDAKVKSSRKKKLKKAGNKSHRKKTEKTCKMKSDKSTVRKYTRTRIYARCKKPNRLLWACNHCGYLTCKLQSPDHKLWINEEASKL